LLVKENFVLMTAKQDFTAQRRDRTAQAAKRLIKRQSEEAVQRAV